MDRGDRGIIVADDGIPRCWWCVDDPLYRAYHDLEWGRPVADDRRIFEKICLEGFQSGLSWLMILRKRENFRKAFKSFDIAAVARFTGGRVDRLLVDSGIVRNRAKIEATINNARRCLELIEEFGSLAAYVWSLEPDRRLRPTSLDCTTLSQMGPSQSAKGMSKDLKRRGWTFVGPTTIYSVMESIGLVNDHISRCHFPPRGRTCAVDVSQAAVRSQAHSASLIRPERWVPPSIDVFRAQRYPVPRLKKSAGDGRSAGGRVAWKVTDSRSSSGRQRRRA